MFFLSGPSALSPDLKPDKSPDRGTKYCPKSQLRWDVTQECNWNAILFSVFTSAHHVLSYSIVIIFGWMCTLMMSLLGCRYCRPRRVYWTFVNLLNCNCVIFVKACALEYHTPFLCDCQRISILPNLQHVSNILPKYLAKVFREFAILCI